MDTPCLLYFVIKVLKTLKRREKQRQNVKSKTPVHTQGSIQKSLIKQIIYFLTIQSTRFYLYILLLLLVFFDLINHFYIILYHLFMFYFTR